jgi:hypothetical protein
MGYSFDRAWTDKLLPEVIENLQSDLGLRDLRVAPYAEDVNRATDLITIGNSVVRIGVRLRTHFYWKNYRNDFTIRSGRPSGVMTELDKILEGWGDYIFYGFANELKNSVVDYHVIDLKQFRRWSNNKDNQAVVETGSEPIVFMFPNFREIENCDGTCFIPFNIDKVDSSIIVKTTTKH